MAGKLWTLEDIEFVKNNYSELGARVCAEELGRPINSVKQKASTYKIKSTKTLSSKAWTEDELSLLKDNYNTLGTVGCMELLPNRTYIAIKNYAGKLGLKVTNNLGTCTHEDYEWKLMALDSSCYPIDRYITSKTAITHSCVEGHTWLARPANILSGSGCPSCANYGFNPDKPGILYYIKILTNNEIYYKVGITNRTVSERFSRDTDKNIKILLEKRFIYGSDAYIEEQDILYKNKHKRVVSREVLKSKGNTELFTEDILGLDIEKAQ